MDFDIPDGLARSPVESGVSSVARRAHARGNVMEKQGEKTRMVRVRTVGHGGVQ